MARGPAYRLASWAGPADALVEEVPVIEISRIYGNFDIRKDLTSEVAEACSG